MNSLLREGGEEGGECHVLKALDVLGRCWLLCTVLLHLIGEEAEAPRLTLLVQSLSAAQWQSQNVVCFQVGT